MASTLLMDYTDVGRTRVHQVGTNNLGFKVVSVAYGTGGFNGGSPTNSLALVSSATTLTAEVYRKPIAHTTIDTIVMGRGKETTYTSVSGLEFTAIIGEAAIFAEVTAPGTTGLPVGQQFMIAQCHFPRVTFSVYSRLAIEWPLDMSDVFFLPIPPLAAPL